MPDTLPRIPTREDLRKVLEAEHDETPSPPPPRAPADEPETES